MYEAFYGFRERPFELTSDSRFLLLTPKHREALSNLKYGMWGRRGITLLIGEAGTGKTSLITAALESERDRDVCVACLASPTLTRVEFFELLARAFGLSTEAGLSKSRFLIELQALVSERRRAGGLTALIVDEAQSLPYELLEEIRLLSNVETPTEKLLPVILAGQPEFADRLNTVGLRQLKQRVALRCTLEPLSLEETAAYIATRIRVAGGDSAKVLTREAVIAIHRFSGGIPRTINVVCDNVLLSGFAADVRPASVSIVREVCRDFDLQDQTQTATAPGATSDTPANGPSVLLSRPASALQRAQEPAAERAQVSPPAEVVTQAAVLDREMFASPPEQRRRFLFFTRFSI